MRVVLRGINTIRHRAKDGTVTVYYYDRASGTRLPGLPGALEFMEKLAQARKKEADPNIFKSVIVAYMASSAFTKKSEHTQRDYRRYLRMIEDRYGSAPIAVIEDPEIRGDFLEWRDELARKSERSADFAITVLGLVLQWAINNGGKVKVNHAARPGRLYASDRADNIWSADQIASFMDSSYVEMQTAMMLALYTASRQGDLIRFGWNNYDGRSIRYRPAKTRSKGGRMVEVPLPAFLCSILDDMKRKRKTATILTARKGAPWREDNFRHEWIRICEATGIEELHWHDLRGTTVTLLWEEGCNDAQIAAITGHSLKTVAEILNRYTGRTRALAEQAAAKLERRLSGIFEERFSQKPLQNAVPGENENAG